jgi:hypothetical protein
MSWNEPGPRYYYNDPSGTPYHDPAWYRGRKDDDDKDDQRKELFVPIEQEALKLSSEEIHFIPES